MAIRDVLVPALQAAFPDRGLRVAETADCAAVFPALCAEVGDLFIYDDEGEATVAIEHITHFHFNPYDSEMSEEERARWITDKVLTFLHELFADRILLYYTKRHRLSGCQPYDGTVPPDVPPRADTFVWSGRV